MKHCENANVIQCMSTYHHISNTQKFQENPKPRSKCMTCMKNEWKRDHTKWEMINLGWNPSGLKVLRERGECLGGEKVGFCWERSKKWDLISRWIYLKKMCLDGLRIFQDLSSTNSLHIYLSRCCWEFVDGKSTLMDWIAIEKLLAKQKLSR